MCTKETVKCPHCGSPRMVHLNGNDTPELIEREPCDECRRTYLKEIADTLFSCLTSRLENSCRSRCSIGEQGQEDLPSDAIFRRILRVESLRHNQGRIGEANFDYEIAQLRVSPRAESGTQYVAIDACHFPLDDVWLNTVVRNFVRALALVEEVKDRDVGEEVRFREQMANIELSFQQPCQHIPPCPNF
jgi:hypothetical protein